MNKNILPSIYPSIIISFNNFASNNLFQRKRVGEADTQSCHPIEGNEAMPRQHWRSFQVSTMQLIVVGGKRSLGTVVGGGRLAAGPV